MGRSKKVTIGYQYYMGIHMGVCRGPVDELVAITADDKTVWEGSQTASGQIEIDRPELFGGKKREGGVSGTLDVMMGGSAQTAAAKLAAMLGDHVPGFRGMMTLFFDGYIAAMSPYIKPWKVRVRRALAGWEAGCWYPAKARIALSGGDIQAMNPAHILYQALTDSQWGGGFGTSRIHAASFESAADRLYSEGFGLCLRWVRTDSVNNFIQTVLDHIAGVLYEDRTDGLFHLTLIRGDYDAEDLPLFTPDTGLLEIQDDENTAISGAANEVVVKWHDPVRDEDRQTRARNLAQIQTDQQIYSSEMELPGIPTAELAGRVAAREVKAQSGTLKRFQVSLDRRGYGIAPGGAFRISDPRRGLENVVLRAGRIEDGKLTDGAMTIDAVMDVFGLPDNAIGGVQPTLWSPPVRDPAAVTVRRCREVSWRDLAAVATAADLAQIDASVSMVCAVGARPASLCHSYDLQTRVGTTGDWSMADEGSWCPNARLDGTIGPAATTWAIADGEDLDDVAVGGAALVDDEIVRMTAITDAGITVARGCADTVPTDHSDGAVIWFYDDSLAVDPTEYGPGVSVQARMLTRTSAGVLAEASAPVDTVDTALRLGRPYPPGLVKINDTPWPETATGDLVLTWAHRDRLTQADQLIDCDQASIGPESGTTYSWRLRRVDTLAVLASGSGASGATTTITGLTYSGDVILELWSVRDSLDSWQRWTHTFSYTA